MLSTRIVKHHPMGTIDKRDKNDSAKIADFLYRYDGTECAKPYKLPSKAMQQLKPCGATDKLYEPNADV